MATQSVRLRRLSRVGAPDGALGRLLESAHLTVAGLVLLGGAVLGWIVARLLGSKMLYLLVYAGVLVMAASWIVARRRLAVSVTRSAVPTRMREGQAGEVTLVVEAQRRATTLIVEEALPEPLGRTVRIPVAAIGGGETIEHQYTFTPKRRGIYEIGPVTASWSDPFGLTTQRQRLADAVPVIVHPSTELVHDRVLSRMWEDPPIRPPVSKPWPTGFEFYGMRDYVRGDDLRRVVWSAVAKTGRMLVRESEQGITDRVSIVLDIDRAWHQPLDPSPTLETAVRVVASLGVRHLADGMSVSLATGDQALTDLRGPRARYALLDELARVQTERSPLLAAGQRLLRGARRGTHVLIVTPHLDKDVTNILRLVLERGSSVVVVKIVWDESDPQSLARAVSLGCQVVQVPVDASIEAAFTHQVGGGLRR